MAEQNEGAQRQDGSPASAFLTGIDWTCFATTSTLSFAVYIFTLAPAVTLGFSGIFSTAAMYGGIPHPPGYPLWTCYAWLSTKFLPVGNIAWRVSVSSATATALACGLIALLVSRDGLRIIDSLSGTRMLTPNERSATRIVSGTVAGLIFGFSGAVWKRAVLADAWPITLLFFTLFVFLIRLWAYNPTRLRSFFIAMLVYGAGLTNSHALAVLTPAIPLLALIGEKRLARDLFLLVSVGGVGALLWAGKQGNLLYAVIRSDGLLFRILIVLIGSMLIGGALLIWRTRGAFTEWRSLLAGSLAVLLGLSFYLYVPTASMTNPPVNWGYARSPGGFVHTLNRGQYDMVYPTPGLKRLGTQIQTYFEAIGRDFGWVSLLPIGLLPFVWRRLESNERRWLVALLGCFFCLSILLVAVLNPTTDLNGQELVQVFYSLSYVVLALSLGCGITIGVTLSRTPKLAVCL